MTNKKPHKHAELFRELAEDGEAWRNWQYFWHSHWENAGSLKALLEYTLNIGCGIQRNPNPPVKKEYIKIGDTLVPAPCREPLECEQKYYLAMGKVSEQEWWKDSDDERWLSLGRIHLTESSAQSHVDAEKKVNTTVMTEE